MSTILSIDPSSTCIGYAVVNSLESSGLVEAGRIKPSTGKDAVNYLHPKLARWLARKELSAMRRIESMSPDVFELIERVAPTVVAVEVPSGLFGTGAKRGARGSLTTYGLAAGRIYELCQHRSEQIGIPCLPITERMWTTGAGNKTRRLPNIVAIYRQYDPSKDPGGDIADAIGIARWAWRELAADGNVEW
jgi:Holliday junction resolvasome RuvABC endonuclease subunit